ncbi:MAG: patatin-like protein [Caldimonas sp.]
MTAAQSARPGEARSEELRLALVLNGGVSLAVWMGGVAYELNRLVRETHPVYEGLLKLTGTAARIDVISGTSAGGINGAALALAQVHDSSLYSLRDVWLDTAGLEQLMRKPDDARPASLLRGDSWFLPRIRSAFDDLAKGKRHDAQRVPILLNLTTTLLDGIGVRRLDDFGAVVEDTVHRARWRFERNEHGDAFASATIVDQLALAARSTASFPIAFEPALFDPADAMFSGMQTMPLSGATPITERKLLLDGGILDNKPFEAALEGIAKLPAQGSTRRVLAYIVPDPSGAAEPRKVDERTHTFVEPTLAEVAVRSLISIPATQSIAASLEKLRKENGEARRRWQRIVGVVRYMGAPLLVRHAGAALETYRVRRVDGIIDYLLGEMAIGLANGAGGRDMTMRRATREWLRSTWQATVSGLPTAGANTEIAAAIAMHRSVWDKRVPTAYSPSVALLTGHGAHWPWGLYAVEFMAEATIELLRRTQRLRGLVKRWVDGAEAVKAGTISVVEGPYVTVAELRDSGVAWERMDGARSPVARVLDDCRARFGDSQTMEWWTEAFDVARKASRNRRDEDVETQLKGAAGFAELVDTWEAKGGEVPPIVKALELLDSLLKLSPEKEVANREQAYALCGVIGKLRGPIDEIRNAAADLTRSIRRAERIERVRQGRLARATRSAAVDGDAGAVNRVAADARTVTRHAAIRGDIAVAVAELAAISDFLFQPLPGDAASEVDRIAWRLLALEVFEVSAASRSRTASTQAEVVQISARLRSAWGGSDDPSGRVNGMQMAHFGAFYKRSWRANDWTFGRLDGIDRAVRIALNPDALQRLYGQRRVKSDAEGTTLPASKYVADFVHGLAVTGAESDLRVFLEHHWNGEAITKELSWLDETASLPPPVLEHCASALTRRLQLEALRFELPEIATSLIAEREGGAEPSPAGLLLLARIAPDGRPAMPTPEAAVCLVGNDLIGGDTMAMQPGSDLFTRTASQGLATAHAALSSRHGGLDAIKALFRVTEWPVRILYWLSNRLSRGSRTAAALEGGALGLGLALVGAALLIPKVPSALIGFGWALLAGVLVATALRQFWLGMLMLALLLAGAVLFDSSAPLPMILAAGAVFLALWLPIGAVVAAVLVVIGAAWWSAGGSAEAWTVLSQQIGLGGGQPVAHSVKELAEAHRLGQALGPAALIVAILLVSVISRSLLSRIRRPGGTSLGDRMLYRLQRPIRFSRRTTKCGEE